MIKSGLSILLNGIFILIVALFMLDAFTAFDIKSQPVKSLIYFGILLLSPAMMFWNILTCKTIIGKLIASVLPMVTLVVILIIGPVNIIFASSAWQTQTILYQNGHLKFKRVEYQMQDAGALGYNKRTVEVTYLTDLFMIVDTVTEDIAQRAEWIKVDIEVNELIQR